jgi:hypothetical protein
MRKFYKLTYLAMSVNNLSPKSFDKPSIKFINVNLISTISDVRTKESSFDKYPPIEYVILTMACGNYYVVSPQHIESLFNHIELIED